MAAKEGDIRTKIAGWLGLSRPPFHTFGILPFVLGTVLAWQPEQTLNIPILVLSVLGALLVMLSTFYTEDYFAAGLYERSRCLLPNRFTGSPVTLSGKRVSDAIALRIGIGAIALAAVTGLVLQFGLGTGPLTLLLGCLGALPGFFYATRFVRLIENGIGELVISICYSWLPLTAAFYLQRGTIAPCIHWMALPIGLATFNVILLNEYPDQPTDPVSGGTNLLARSGKTGGMNLYVLCSILAWISLYASLAAGIPRKALYLYLPVLALSAVICFMMARRKYENHFLLEWIGGLNIAVYLGTTTAYLLAFF